jgi:hypothetical protein
MGMSGRLDATAALTPGTITQDPGLAPVGGLDGFNQIYISYSPSGIEHRTVQPVASRNMHDTVCVRIS